MKILCIGEAVLDKVYFLETNFKNGLKFVAKDFYYELGGSALRAGLVLKKLGADVVFITCLGKDKEGEIVLNELRKRKIKVVFSLSETTKENIVIVTKEDRSIIKKPIKKQKLKIKNINLIKSSDLIILDRHYSEVFDILMKNKKPETEIIFDPSTEISSRTIKILKKVNYPILPWEAIKILGKDFRSGVKKLMRIIKKPYILTCGKFGSVLIDKKIKFFNSYKGKIVNSNGAGDFFRGAFAYGILNKFDLESNLDWSNYVSAFCLERNLKFSKNEIKKRVLKKNNFSLKDVVENFRKI